MTEPAARSVRSERVVVMGVSGSGKTTIGALAAERLGVRFVDADSLHPAANVEKMAAGIALTDDDRRPWLEALCLELRSPDPVLVTCSALQRRSRDTLRRAGGVTFVFLHVDLDTVLDRVRARTGHFMKADMVDGQFATLEAPVADEQDVIVIDAVRPVAEVVDAVLDALEDR